MKTAIMNPQDEILHYVEWANPVIASEDEVLIHVKARVIGGDGVSVPNGKRLVIEMN